MKVCVLASGSKGNCTFISDGTTKLLIDAGLSCKRIETLLQSIGESLGDITAILVTHEHADHIMGLRTIDKKYEIPILCNIKTATCIDVRLHINSARWYKNNFDTGFKIGNISVLPFRTAHDAVSPVGYVFNVDGKKIAYVTDLGYVTQGVYDTVKGSELVIMESNHDLKMLTNGSYPIDLQARIKGPNGHLSNVQSAEICLALVQAGAKHLILAHLSEENNTPELASEVNRQMLENGGIKVGQDVTVEIAYQDHPTSIYEY
jgi:phosphoribosyl 1,2-cyclic phosphodiesterase